MTSRIINQTSFTAGELTPRLYGRADTSEFARAVETAKNAVLLPHGPIARRPGTKYIASTKSNQAVRLIRYQISQDNSYILEFGNLYIRFFTQSGQLLSGGSPYEIVSPYTTAQLDEIQYVQTGSSMYLVHPEVPPQLLVRNDTLDWTITELEFSPPPTVEDGFSPNVTLTPSATTGYGVTFTASSATFLEGDVDRQIINLTTGETGTAVITSVTSSTVCKADILTPFTDTSAIAAGDWKLDLSPVCDLEFSSAQVGAITSVYAKYLEGSKGSPATITGISKANPGVVTTSAAHGFAPGDRVVVSNVKGMTQVNGKVYTVGTTTSTTFQLKDDNNNNLDTTNYTTYTSGGSVALLLTDIQVPAFRSADEGKYILANGGVLEIVNVISDKEVEAVVLKGLNSAEDTSNWSLEEPTWNADRGYPSAVGLYQQRLVLAGTTKQPQTVWFSETGVFDGFGIGPDDEDSIEIDLTSNEVNKISWVAASRDLIIGTSGAEITISPASQAGLTPSSIEQRTRTYHGSRAQQPALVREEVLFIQGSNRKIRTFRYDFNLDGYTGEDLTFLSEHITEGGIKELVYSQEPDTIVYAVMNNGDMVTGTYDRSKQVIGWSRFDTDGEFERVQTITSGETDQIWLVVKRTINGSTKRYIELLTPQTQDSDTAGYSDSFLIYSMPKTISGISLASPAVVTATAHGYSNGDTVVIKGLVDPYEGSLDEDKPNMSSINGNIYKVANVTANTFELKTLANANVDLTGFNAYGSGGVAHKRVTTLSNLSHLEGRTVQIKTDGAVHPDKVVSGGAVSLEVACGEAVVGLAYKTTIKTLAHEFDIGRGSMQGQRTRWVRPQLQVYKSVRPRVNGSFIPNRTADDKLSQRVELFSGFLEYNGLQWDKTGSLTITTLEPLPLQISSITGVIEGGVK